MNYMLSQGCSSPLVVKFADTQKEKDAKRLQQVTQNLWNVASANNLAALGPQYLAVSHTELCLLTCWGLGKQVIFLTPLFYNFIFIFANAFHLTLVGLSQWTHVIELPLS